MADFRFVYGVARGPVNNFTIRTDNLLANTDATPDVTLGNLFHTDPANTATITYFDVTGANPVSEHQGKEIGILFGGTGTTLTDGTLLSLKGGQSWSPDAGDVGEFIFVNSTWYEKGRTVAGDQVLSVTSSNLGTAAAPRLTIRNSTTTVLALAAASSLMTLHAMPGGVDGQQVTIIAVGSQVTFTTNSAGLSDGFITTATGTTTMILNGSAASSFVRATMGGTAKWFQTQILA